MRLNYNQAVWFLSMLPSIVWAVSVNPNDSVKLIRPEHSADIRQNLWLSLVAESGSNGFNQYMMNRLAFGGYMSPDEISNAESIIKKNNRTGLVFATNLAIPLRRKPDTAARPKFRFQPTHLEFSGFQLMGSTYSKGSFQAVFRGNGYFLGQTLKLDPSGMKYFAGRTVKVDFNDMFLSGNSAFSASVGIGQLTSFRSLKLTQGSIFTEINRDYADVMYSGEYFTTGRRNQAGAAYGGVVDISLKWRRNSNTGYWYFYARNMGVYRTTPSWHLHKNMDSAIRISQAVIGVKGLNTDSWIEDLRDTINGGLAPDSTRLSRWVASPFSIEIAHFFKGMMFRLAYVNLPGYLPRFTVFAPSLTMKAGPVHFRPELQLGGFDTYNVNMSVHLMKKTVISSSKSIKTSLIFLNASGLESLVFPRKEHGAGATIMCTIPIH